MEAGNSSQMISSSWFWLFRVCDVKLSLEYLPASPISACALLSSFVHNPRQCSVCCCGRVDGQCVLGALVSIG